MEPSIESLDLSMIKLKLMDPVEGEGWPEGFADAVIAEYRRFLILTKKHPDQGIVPSSLVDKVWHNHILDTRAYGPDCEKIFGSFLHHFPYWGMRGDDDLADLYSSWDNSLKLYQETFGTVPSAYWVNSTPARCPKCGSGSTCFVAGTKVRMADSTEKPIEEIALGDATVGGIVTGLQVFTGHQSALYKYKDILVSGSHAVFEDGSWKRVASSLLAVKVSDHAPTLYCFSCVDHRIYVGETMFADYDEVDPLHHVTDVAHQLNLEALNAAACINVQ